MTRTFFTAALTALALLPVTATAQQFKASNHMTVAPQPDGSFEVSGNPEIWARDYWCAAGDYARRVLDLPVDARLAVAEPYAKGSRSVAFQPVANADRQFRAVVMGLSIRSAGTNLSVGEAHGFCADHRLRNSR